MRLIYIAFVAAIMFSCDEVFDLQSINQAPKLVVQKNGLEFTTLSDSLKTSLKHGKPRYTLTLYASDVDGIASSISVQTTEGVGAFYNKGTQGTSFTPEGGKLILEYEPSGSTPNHKLLLTVTDNLGAVSTAEVQILVFVNLKPVAKMQMQKNSKALQYGLDATGSFDQDAKQGGHVAYYYWKINGVELISDKVISPKDFPSAGKYDIILRVQDDDGEFSDEIKLPQFEVVN